MGFYFLVLICFVWTVSGSTRAEKWNEENQHGIEKNSGYNPEHRRDRRYTSYGSSYDRDQNTEFNGGFTTDRERNRERGNDRVRENDRDRGQESNRDRGYGSSNGDRNRGTSGGYESNRNRGNYFDQERDRNRDTSSNSGNDRNRGTNWNNGNDRNRETGRYTGNDRNRENDSNRGDDGNRGQDRNRNKGKDRDNVTFQGLNNQDVKEQRVRAYWPWIDEEFPRPVQSPVAISTKNAKKESLPTLDFENYWENTKELVTLRNDGNTVQVLIDENVAEEDRPKIKGGPLKDDYLFEQMHMHWGTSDDDGSEHTLNGQPFSTEMHIVHFKKAYGTLERAQRYYDGIAVVAFFGVAKGRDNKALGGYINDLSRVRKCNSSVTIPVKRTFECVKDIASPGRGKTESRYYAYPGSLTTPPFSESVIWIVFPDTFQLSSRQLSEFRQLRSCDNKALIRKNDRELQPFNSRPVIFSF